MDLSVYPELIQSWYDWGVLVGVIITLLVAGWILLAAVLKQRHSTLWQITSVLLLIMSLPGVVFWVVIKLEKADSLPAVEPVAYVGMAAAVLSLLIWLLFVIGVAVGTSPELTYGVQTPPPFGGWPPPQGPPGPAAPPPPPGDWAQPATRPAQPLAQPPPVPPSAPSAPTVQVGSKTAPGWQSDQPLSPKTEVLQREPARMAWLVVTSGVRIGQEFRLGETTTIGRTGDSDIVLDDTGISRQHARVRLRDDQFVLHDLASTNGTFVKNKETGEWEQIDRHVLQSGDQIKIGRVELSFMEIAPNAENT